MMIFFVIFMVVLALIFQKQISESCLENIREDYWPDENIVEPDECFDLVISLQNVGKRDISYVRVETYFSKVLRLHMEGSGITKDVERGGKSVSCSAWLRPYQEVQFQIPISIAERGLYVLPHPSVFGGDFLGLREQRRIFERFREVVVAPKEASDQELQEVLGSFLGDYSVRRFLYEDPVLTVGYREYTGREPMKMISWKQSVRGNGLMVKQYDYTMEPMISVILNVDSRADDKENLLERCFSLARTICRTLEDNGIPYDFSTNATMTGSLWECGDMEEGKVPEGIGPQHFASVLECLGRASYNSSCSCNKLIEKVAAKFGMDRGKILITPGDDMLEGSACSGLKDRSEGNFLIIRASEDFCKVSENFCKASEVSKW